MFDWNVPFPSPGGAFATIWIGNQYRDTGWFPIFFVLMLAVFIFVNIRRAGKGKDLYIRRIGGLNAIDEAIGRATEMGKPVLMVPGLSDNVNAIVVQALNIFSYVSRTAAKFANPILLCCANAAVYTVAQETIRDVYQQEGAIDRYDADSVRFISDRQFAFAAGVSGLIHRERFMHFERQYSGYDHVTLRDFVVRLLQKGLCLLFGQFLIPKIEHGPRSAFG